MLVDGVNHVALLTADTDRLHAFYGEVFGATVAMDSTDGDGFRISIVVVGSARCGCAPATTTGPWRRGSSARAGSSPRRRCWS